MDVVFTVSNVQKIVWFPVFLIKLTHRAAHCRNNTVDVEIEWYLLRIVQFPLNKVYHLFNCGEIELALVTINTAMMWIVIIYWWDWNIFETSNIFRSSLYWHYYSNSTYYVQTTVIILNQLPFWTFILPALSINWSI